MKILLKAIALSIAMGASLIVMTGCVTGAVPEEDELVSTAEQAQVFPQGSLSKDISGYIKKGPVFENLRCKGALFRGDKARNESKASSSQKSERESVRASSVTHNEMGHNALGVIAINTTGTRRSSLLNILTGCSLPSAIQEMQDNLDEPLDYDECELVKYTVACALDKEQSVDYVGSCAHKGDRNVADYAADYALDHSIINGIKDRTALPIASALSVSLDHNMTDGRKAASAHAIVPASLDQSMIHVSLDSPRPRSVNINGI